MSLRNGKCEIKRRLFGNCGAPTIGSCQYCGTAFCGQHGDLIDEDHQEVCSRPICVEKKVDLAKHLAYKSATAGRNSSGSCGIEGCPDAIDLRCVRCQGYFCNSHVSAQQVYVADGSRRVQGMAPHCQHCWNRRPIWQRN